MQKENYRHFEDTVNPVTGCVRVIENGEYKGLFSHHDNVTHYINMRGAPQHTQTPTDDIVFYLSGHQSRYFQHFFDNGLPHISLMLLATGYKPKDVVIVMPAMSTETIQKVLKRWGFKDVRRGSTVSAKKLVLPEIVPVIHPKFYEVFRQAMNFDHYGADKIVFVSRKLSKASKKERIILNQDIIIKELTKKYGKKVVLYKPTNSFTDSYKIFEKAKVIIGSHGGGMYNAFYAPPHAKIVEIMPITSSGLYYKQLKPTNRPPFAHLAIYTNSQLLGQSFYRFYQISDISTNMVVDVDKFMHFIKQVMNDE